MESRHLIEPDELADLAGPLLILDLCRPDQYGRGHIPGAVHVSPQELVDGRPPAPGLPPDERRLRGLACRLGLAPEVAVVVYDDEGGGWAGRMAWTLDLLGHRNWRYLNGGLVAWQAAGLPLEREPRAPLARPVEPAWDPRPLVELAELRGLLGRPEVVIWDARSREEYEGLRSGSRRAGHIPGAVHCEWTSLMDPARGLRIREDAAERLADLGIRPDRTVITHCQTHHRSGFTYLVGRVLGFPEIRAYAGSWAEWGNRDDTPVATGPNP
ncbi:MAG: sulfurtransferase [Porticoccaceae bacterium]|nr:MAG: sulfurtransferase [Porticoccaceae bacterium]